MSKPLALRWVERIRAAGKVCRRPSTVTAIETREPPAANGWESRKALLFRDGSEAVVSFGNDGFTFVDWWGDRYGPQRWERQHEFATFERDDLPAWIGEGSAGKALEQ